MADKLVALTGRREQDASGYGMCKTIQNLAYHAKLTRNTWAALAGVLGLNSEWPDWKAIDEAKTRIARLKPGADGEAVRDKINDLRRQLDRMECDLVGAPPCP
ncbi:hypothetical protein [Azospirillum sp. SYSU D00513]|uniref:hypothetical protein n=1 Tax=Azospirillum sp. SYSU D00513 TaxID=2812561 RepID=UPI001A979D72|nr:hypothetical protein [Azospirillum sp. SYSU D00513]